jgi:hypothetical protein
VNDETKPEDKKSVRDFLLDLPQSYIDAERIAKYERDATAYKADQFYMGHQQLFQADDGWWYPIEDGELYWIVNIFAYHVRANAKEFARSRPELIFRAMDRSFRAESAARAATAWWNHVDQQFFTESFLQREAKRMQCHGGAWRYVWWNPAGGEVRQKPRLTPTEVPVSPAATSCRMCGTTGPPEAFPIDPALHCPDCGNMNLDIQPEQTTPALEPDGSQITYPIGDIIIEQPDGFEMWTQSTARDINDAVWFRRDRRVDRAKVAYLYPGKKLRPYVQSTYNDRGPMYQRRTERSHGGADKGVETLMDMTSMREVEFIEDWFRPEAYFNYTVPLDADPMDPAYILPNGVPMTPGQSLTDVFPDGFRLVRSGDELLDIVAENPHECLEYIAYDILPGRFWGKGIEDAIPVQENYNETMSLLFTNMMNCDSPVTLYDQSIIKNPGRPGSPNRQIAVGERPPNSRLSDAMVTLPGVALPNEVWNFLRNLKEDMQLIFGAFSTFSGSPDVNVDTATVWPFWMTTPRV